MQGQRLLESDLLATRLSGDGTCVGKDTGCTLPLPVKSVQSLLEIWVRSGLRLDLQALSSDGVLGIADCAGSRGIRVVKCLQPAESIVNKFFMGLQGACRRGRRSVFRL